MSGRDGSGAAHTFTVAALAVWCGLVFTVMGAVVGAPSASAHDWLVHSTPAAGATVRKAPANVELTFDDRVLTKPAEPRVTVIGPEGKHHETGCATALGRDVRVPWTPGRPGKYTVEWRIISADGHPVSAGITFTYAGAPGTNEGRDAAPACATHSSPGVAAKGEGSSSAPVVVASVAAAVALGVIALMLVRARRGARPASASRDEEDD